MIKKLTGNEGRILEYFAEKPEKIHIRGLSEELDMPYPSVRKALKDLEEEEYLQSDRKSKMTFYSPTDKKFRQAKKLINLEKLQDSKITEFLEKELRPEAIVLFGSYLEGRDTGDSDIDIAIIGGREKNLDLKQFQKKLGREIQLTEVEELKEEKPEFRNSLANGLVLQGYLEVV